MSLFCDPLGEKYKHAFARSIALHGTISGHTYEKIFSDLHNGKLKNRQDGPDCIVPHIGRCSLKKRTYLNKTTNRSIEIKLANISIPRDLDVYNLPPSELGSEVINICMNNHINVADCDYTIVCVELKNLNFIHCELPYIDHSQIDCIWTEASKGEGRNISATKDGKPIYSFNSNDGKIVYKFTAPVDSIVWNIDIDLINQYKKIHAELDKIMEHDKYKPKDLLKALPVEYTSKLMKEFADYLFI